MDYASIITSAAQSIGVLPKVLLAICTVESGLTPVNTYKDNGKKYTSYSICQAQRPAAHQVIGTHIDALALQQPLVNAEVAARYLKYHLDRYGNYYEAIAAYNAGRAKYGEDGELINKLYLDKVIKTWYNIDRRNYDTN